MTVVSGNGIGVAFGYALFLTHQAPEGQYFHTGCPYVRTSQKTTLQRYMGPGGSL